MIRGYVAVPGMRIRHFILIAVLLFPVFAALSEGRTPRDYHFHLDGDRITLRAHREPLGRILNDFARAGVRVQMDPGLQERVTGRVENADLEETLDQLLQNQGYVLVWEVVRGSFGAIPKLAEIHLFRPGHEEDVRPLIPPDAPLTISWGPDGQGPPHIADEVLIAIAAGATADEVRLLLRQIGGALVEGVSELGIYRIRLPPGTNLSALIAQLRQNPLMDHVEPNYVYRAPRRIAVDPAAGDVPQPLRVPGPAAGGAPVAILDSGLNPGAPLDDFVVGSLDAWTPGRELADALGHGTQMALIAAGAIAPGGIAPDANPAGVPIVAIRAFDDQGYASTYSLLRSVTYAADQGARVMNMSWGTETQSDFLRDAMAYAQSRNLLVVASAGNEPHNRPMYPAAYPGVIAVSALDASGGRWEQSNFGDFVFLAAPGMASFPASGGSAMQPYAGTSIASAYVTRALGLYYQKNPRATRAQALQDLRRSLTPAGESGRDPYFGYGILDDAAMKRLLGGK